MHDLLRQFEAELIAQGFDPGYFFQPGASAAAVTSALAETGFPVPADLMALYTWKNGTAMQSAAEFAAYFAKLDTGNQAVLWPDQSQKPPGYCYRTTDFLPEIGVFMPLGEAATAYWEAKQKNYWPANFWPVFHDDVLLLDLDPDSATYGQVHYHSPSLMIFEPEPYYDSLESMFIGYLTALQSRIVPFGPDSEPGFSQYHELATRLNPLSTFWRS